MATTCELEAKEKKQNKSECLVICEKTYAYELLEDVHLTLSTPAPSPAGAIQGKTLHTRGHFKYFHYGCDGTLDAGWGCGYRTLQTAISWIQNRRKVTQPRIPSIREIQRILVSIGDKLPQFVDSHDWIGTLEEFYVIDAIFELPCRILHVQKLNSDQVIGQILSYFEKYAGFIVIGGLSDTASKGIAGIHQQNPTRDDDHDVFLLIVDPHFSGVPSSKQQLISQGYVRWMHISEFQESAYNLCFILQE